MPCRAATGQDRHPRVDDADRAVHLCDGPHQGARHRSRRAESRVPECGGVSARGGAGPSSGVHVTRRASFCRILAYSARLRRHRIVTCSARLRRCAPRPRARVRALMVKSKSGGGSLSHVRLCVASCVVMSLLRSAGRRRTQFTFVSSSSSTRPPRARTTSTTTSSD